MSFKMKLAVCLMALSTAIYARAQEKAGTTQKQDQTNSSQVEKARTPSNSPATTDNQNQRRDANPAKSTDARTNENRTGKDQNRNPRDTTTRDTTTTQRTEIREQHANAGNSSPIDAQLASCLLIGNQKEVTISQFASERAKNEKVKEFARQMVKDHTQAISMLQRFAGPDASKDLSSGDINRGSRSETTIRSTTTTDSSRANQDGDRNANRDGANNRRANENPNVANRAPDAPAAVSDTPARATNLADRNANASSDRTSAATVQIRNEHEAMPDKMLAIQREVAQKCIAMAKQELEQSSNFDQAYVGMQIAEHMGMIAHLETYKSYASPDLGKVISESLDTAQGHLRHAKELVMEIGRDQAGSSRSSSTSDASNRNAKGSDTDSRNSPNRDDATPRREGVFKKDAPKS